MFVHKQFLREHINTDKEAQKDFAYFLYIKSRFRNSAISSNTPDIIIARHLKMDVRTYKKAMGRIKDRGWLKPIDGDESKGWLLKSINKDYEYRQMSNGKADKKKNGKYYKVRIFRKYTLKQIRNIVRGLLCKSFYQKQLYATHCTKEFREHSSKREIASIHRLAYDFGYRRRGQVEPGVLKPMGIRLIGKMIGMSRSSADRLVKSLAEDQLILRKVGQTDLLGLAEKLKPGSKLYYGAFIQNGIVYRKHLNSYAF